MEGFVVPSWMSLDSSDNFDDFVNSNFSLKIGQVVKINYPDDNNGFKTITYDVMVNDKSDGYNQVILFNCQVLDKFGGLADFATYTLRANDKDINGITDGKVQNSELLGSYVIVGLINGSAATPIILGGVPYTDIPDGSDRKVPKEDDGHNLKFVFNGVNVEINKDGELNLIKNGPTKSDGTLDTDKSNDDQKGSFVKIDKDGNITLSANEKNIFIINKKDKKITIDGEDVIINGGDKGAARIDDEVKSTQAEDAKFWTWFTVLKTVLASPIPEVGNGAPSQLQLALNLALSTIFPDSLTSKVTKGSSHVKIG